MTEQIKLAGEQGSLVIEVRGYERPAAADQDDANWLKCAITVRAGPFSGSFSAALTTYDLLTLHARLKERLAPLPESIDFENTEGDVSVEIRFDNRGGAAIKCKVHPAAWPETSLSANFDSDQSYLSETVRQLESALRRFPVKQAQGPKRTGVGGAAGGPEDRS